MERSERERGVLGEVYFVENEAFIEVDLSSETLPSRTDIEGLREGIKGIQAEIDGGYHLPDMDNRAHHMRIADAGSPKFTDGQLEALDHAIWFASKGMLRAISPLPDQAKYHSRPVLATIIRRETFRR